MKIVSVVLVIFALVGCATNQPSERGSNTAAADSVEFMRPYELSRTDVSVISLGDVEGRSCQANIFDDKPSQEQAIVLLKVAAAELSANRVVLRTCREEKTDSCRASWVCHGQALQVEPLR
ncbi:Rcs stress response system protein RcsF [Pseudidiomarina donghaiensis]|uniref:RcsF protein n=1 Tax=Pseudidiomarina donghaiensis TaxID=519452 RepID=A0A432XFY0_9GAMM|nr:Rcs stress response system protein RcsF [Pseudidiomarina donghaiensis]RUO47467.1 hypothetical protein CWE24_09125 [Pseudidiomarina donghaiensis]SFV23079.1 RcsF lipoprotein [Pseudidiomarina donghaiensis]